MRVALYARVSTQRQERQGTIDSQIAALRKYAHENHYNIAEEYACKDDGYKERYFGAVFLMAINVSLEETLFPPILSLMSQKPRWYVKSLPGMSMKA